ncbi:hypothetical protein [Sulfitobacter donghicola]|uniref:Uncharacterized protein n=1 Tax=Sulfitobacter donghicola DSW-25 = KCTC 12864 = JCM 14565 TaxID=1300350 RepID=A0A073IWF9_9RHOB|nr:hypothetical protein [Sulfitobacter donghicola]KEJ89712.1 hypothetical protein DSW25_05670 [Sulfitobacter donghicola DSW-25 = KCTC 12864 = JCM 14565]KIN67195.1 hypothetical protein Z948_901 [Sulfitobacter donghicola DSW-25 = KCTC 12864 = JCM 14565]
MRDFAPFDPSLAEIIPAFIQTLERRVIHITSFALAAWDGETLQSVNGSLVGARELLAQIATEAAAAGYPAIGADAGFFIDRIDGYLDGPYADLAICPGDIVWWADYFAQTCYRLLESTQSDQAFG